MRCTRCTRSRSSRSTRSNYSTFIAEIPSTSLELILQDYMSENAESIDEKLFYLGFGLEGMRGTFFRQTMFAEFELRCTKPRNAARPCQASASRKCTERSCKRYHGHDQGVVLIDDLYTNEWMFIPHFYYNMYVFQYATSQTAGTALYRKDQGGRKRRRRELQGPAARGRLGLPVQAVDRRRRRSGEAGTLPGLGGQDERDHGRDGETSGERDR